MGNSACIRIAAALVLSLAAAASTGAAADTSGMGTWKMNPQKSSFNPGPAPQSLTTHFERAGDGVKWKSERVTPDGKTVVSTYEAKYDGKDYPIKGSPTADTVVLRRIDARTSERINKKDGKVGTTERREIAADGRSYTTTVTGKTAKGEPINHRMVFDKQ